MHFASFIQVGESMREPSRYYDNNLIRTISLLDQMVAANVKHLIFSSTAALFGEPQVTPIPESHSIAPINPYGRTKAMVEGVLGDYWAAYNLASVSLRYFNAAGADPDGELGERHEPETHLIPLVLQAASGRRHGVSIYGTDYDTPDGTCIRDYIHVTDLCEAHLLALNSLLEKPACRAYNLGNGHGFSVREVIEAAQSVTGKTLSVSVESRRVGDPARLVADSTLARQDLGWQPVYAGLDVIVRHAWCWERKMARGDVPGR
jgi:UDP-glucose 4-epimerase